MHPSPSVASPTPQYRPMYTSSPTVVAVVLTLKSDVAVRRIVLANLVLRGGGAAVAMMPILQSAFPLGLLRADPGGQALGLHLAFNLALVLVGLPLAGPIMRVAGWIVPAPTSGADARAHRSFLDRSVLDQPRRAFGCAIRELVQMGDLIETMLRRSIRLFEHYDETAAARIQNDFAVVARMSLDLRIYLAAVREREGAAEIGTRAFDVSGIAVGLEAAGLVGVHRRLEVGLRARVPLLVAQDEEPPLRAGAARVASYVPSPSSGRPM